MVGGKVFLALEPELSLNLDTSGEVKNDARPELKFTPF